MLSFKFTHSTCPAKCCKSVKFAPSNCPAICCMSVKFTPSNCRVIHCMSIKFTPFNCSAICCTTVKFTPSTDQQYVVRLSSSHFPLTSNMLQDCQVHTFQLSSDMLQGCQFNNFHWPAIWCETVKSHLPIIQLYVARLSFYTLHVHATMPYHNAKYTLNFY